MKRRRRGAVARKTEAGELSLPGFWRSETSYAETFHVWATSATRRAESMGVRGCWWWDSNPQGLSPGDVKGLCVYRFRHTSTSTSPTANPGNPEGQDARSRTRRRSRGKYFFGLLNARIKFLRSGLFSPVRAAAR